jgi:hypothetical protein
LDISECTEMSLKALGSWLLTNRQYAECTLGTWQLTTGKDLICPQMKLKALGSS